jgi:hypothetical protein
VNRDAGYPQQHATSGPEGDDWSRDGAQLRGSGGVGSRLDPWPHAFFHEDCSVGDTPPELRGRCVSGNFESDDEHGPRLADLTRDGGIGEMLDREIARETESLSRQVDAYREAAVDRELRLRATEAAEADIMAEADRRSGRHLRSVQGA